MCANSLLVSVKQDFCSTPPEIHSILPDFGAAKSQVSDLFAFASISALSAEIHLLFQPRRIASSVCSLCENAFRLFRTKTTLFSNSPMIFQLSRQTAEIKRRKAE